MPHALPLGDVSRRVQVAVRVDPDDARRSCLRASPRTAPTWAQQQPPSTSGTPRQRRATATFCSASVCSATTPDLGQRQPEPGRRRPGLSARPQARGTRTRPAAKLRPHAWHSYPAPTATAVSVRQCGATGTQDAHLVTASRPARSSFSNVTAPITIDMPARS